MDKVGLRGGADADDLDMPKAEDSVSDGSCTGQFMVPDHSCEYRFRPLDFDLHLFVS